MTPLPPALRTIMTLAAQREQVSRMQLVQALYGMRHEADWPRDPYKCLDVHIVRLRRWLRPYGLTLHTLGVERGTGATQGVGLVGFAPADRAKVRFIIKNYWKLVIDEIDPDVFELHTCPRCGAPNVCQ